MRALMYGCFMFALGSLLLVVVVGEMWEPAARSTDTGWMVLTAFMGLVYVYMGVSGRNLFRPDGWRRK